MPNIIFLCLGVLELFYSGMWGRRMVKNWATGKDDVQNAGVMSMFVIHDFLGSTNYLIVWDKQSNNNTTFRYSKAEIAYTNIRIPCNLVSIPWDGYRMGKETGTKKIHPHQKPVALYTWLLQNYAHPGDIILDTHVGSAASLVACHRLGFSYIGFEKDPHYYNLAKKRLDIEKSQMTIFDFGIERQSF